MGDYLLDSLIIKGFRGFKRLEIEKFAAVNLIVGKNSIGKTSLLEAILLYCLRGNPNTLLYLLENRQESLPRALLGTQRTHEAQTLYQSIKHLFHTQSFLSNAIAPASFAIAPIDEEGVVVTVAPHPDLPTEMGIRIQFSGIGILHKLSDLFLQPTTLTAYLASVAAPPPFTYIPTTGLTTADITTYWNNINLTPVEEKISEALNLIISGITRFGLQDTPAGKVPIVLYNGQRMPLRSLGDGLTKLLEVALALANAQNGAFIIDEIGGGLHYSVQTKMWEFLMTLAKELNVQIFATTHSNDCVKAFEYVSNQLTDVEGQIIRLEKWGEETTAVVIDENLMEVAFEERIEVR